jgi:LacI family transcriptional regulator
MRVTLKDIAAKIGVSKNAVSLALRESPRVSPRLRQRVMRVAEEMGYAPDPFLQRLAEYRNTAAALKSHGVIAWLNHWDKPERLRGYKEHDKCWLGAKEAAKRLGYRLEEFIWPVDCSGKCAEQMLVDRGVLGLLIPPHMPTVALDDFDWRKFSVIRFGMSVQNPDSNLVTSDHHRSVMMAVKKMHDYGYKRIGMILNAAHDRSMGGNYWGGFLCAQRLLKLDPLIPPMTHDLQFKRVLDEWMKRYQPDAIFNHFIEVPAYLGELGYRIPQDVAMAGSSALDIPGVDTGITQHSKAIGRIAAEMLIKQISLNERGVPDAPCRILVESRWQDGKTLPPRQG